ncbi:MAG TPA: hypothetical protein VL282_07005, partial [Tepidisphaeraceae bacterium]|nr:hypothetical protein [Tepidisphaeraceae bacterium]
SCAIPSNVSFSSGWGEHLGRVHGDGDWDRNLQHRIASPMEANGPIEFATGLCGGADDERRAEGVVGCFTTRFFISKKRYGEPHPTNTAKSP